MEKKSYMIRTEESVVYHVEATSKEEALDKFWNTGEDVVEWKRDGILACEVCEC